MEVELLRTMTASLGDRRLLPVVASVAADDARPRKLRSAALRVLVSYADPLADVAFDAQRDSSRIAIGDVADFVQEPGPQPLTASDRKGIPGRLRHIARVTTDPYIQAVAQSLSEGLERRLQMPSKEK